MEIIYVKKIEFTNKCNGIVKSKWNDSEVHLQIFIEKDIDIWNSYEGNCTIESFRQQCNEAKVSYQEVKDCFTSHENIENIYFEIGTKRTMDFSVFSKLMPASEEILGSVIENTYFKLPIREITATTFETVKIINELKIMSEKCIKQDNVIKEYQEFIEKFTDIIEKKKTFDDKIFKEFLLLLNSKKKFINSIDSTLSARKKPNFNASSDFDQSKNDSNLNISTTKNRQPKTPLKNTSKASTSRQKPKRTPSKKFSQMLQEKNSDSDDTDYSMNILSCNSNKQKTQVETLDTSFSIFKNLTPIKAGKSKVEERRESSVELKIEKKKNEVEKKIFSTVSESEDTSEDRPIIFQNAQKLMTTSDDGRKESLKRKAKDTEDSDTDDEDIDDTLKYYTTKEQMKRLKETKLSNNNPYLVDTIDVLDEQ